MTGKRPTIGSLAQRVLGRVARAPGLDGPARLLQGGVRRGIGGGALGEVLRGNWLGHALHPLLTDFTNGPWMAASFLDLFGPKGSAPAARRLVGFGLVAAVPTLLSGLFEWEDTDDAERRLGLAHAATSSLATVFYAGSFLARRKGNERGAVALGLLGGIVAFADGYVGGDLALVGRVGSGRRLPGDRRR
jgi:hypothetical protein